MFNLNDTLDFFIFTLVAILFTGVLAIILANWISDNIKK